MLLYVLVGALLRFDIIASVLSFWCRDFMVVLGEQSLLEVT